VTVIELLGLAAARRVRGQCDDIAGLDGLLTELAEQDRGAMTTQISFTQS
jgi:hypothetical protein